MPKRTDLHSILLLGAGPIVIGQACEFDYSGTQAARALRQEGYRVILVNSNPATIMTDPETADATYIEPLTVESIEAIIAVERPDAIIPTMGGQTALNLAKTLHETGILARHRVELLGANVEAIRRGEDREAFRQVCREAGIDVPIATVVRSVAEGIAATEKTGYPVVLRPAFTLGGTGSGIARDEEELRSLLAIGLAASPVGEVLVEEYLLHWKEFELEVMRDAADRCVEICSIENLDPMGVHTGDSITVAPALTLADGLHQEMRDAAFAILRGVGVATGGSNVQFALDPKSERIVAIEMNPRVSRSSALASKATGFPIARIAALLAVGYLLDEIPNEITGRTMAAFEPALDYVVVKIPRFAFEKFKEADQTLTTSMKSVGEVMAIGRIFPESLQKALRGLEIGRHGLAADGKGLDGITRSLMNRPADDPERLLFLGDTLHKIEVPNCDRIFNLKYALMLGVSAEEISRRSGIDPWFIRQIERLVRFEEDLRNLVEAKRLGYSDVQLAFLLGESEAAIRARRPSRVYKSVDTCAGEFEARTPYHYGTFGEEDEVVVSTKPAVMILGSGPNRIGQGIEFDCCCVHAARALRKDDFEVVMVNSNPETVSTDYDTSDRLFFEPVTVEDVAEIHDRIRPRGATAGSASGGAIISLGGQTPLSIARGIEARGVRILGTSVEAIDRAEDRERFAGLLRELGLKAPAHRTVGTIAAALAAAREIGYPLLVRPSYVLGGRAMAVTRSDEELLRLGEEALAASENRPLLIDEYLEGALEADVDALRDGRETVICGIMEHVEPAGVHSGDSAASFPAYSLAPEIIESMRAATRRLAAALEVRGLINVQFAIHRGELYLLEVNPRASRTVPFLEKATGVDWSGAAARIMAGRTLRDLGLADGTPRDRWFVKEVVLPFNRFERVDPVLSPEMKSTGEVMGIGRSFAAAYLKAQLAAGNNLPRAGGLLFTLADRDKTSGLAVAAEFARLGYQLFATAGTAAAFGEQGIAVVVVHKRSVIERLVAGEIRLVINTRNDVLGSGDARRIDRAALLKGVPVYSTLRAAAALLEALKVWRADGLAPPVRLQEL